MYFRELICKRKGQRYNLNQLWPAFLSKAFKGEQLEIAGLDSEQVIFMEGLFVQTKKDLSMVMSRFKKHKTEFKINPNLDNISVDTKSTGKVLSVVHQNETVDVNDI